MIHARALHASAALVILGMIGCAKNPVTGKRQLALISQEQEIELGRQAAREVVASIGLVDDPELQSYVGELGKKLADGTERPDLPWTFQVLDDPTPNAFALPGGFIFVTRGLLTHFNSEAELAMVLGHEIGHVTARHSVEQLSQAQLAQLGLGVGMILVPDLARFGGLASAGLQLLFLKFGRDDERQADRLGFRYALQDDYDVRAGAHIFETLDRLGRTRGEGRLPEWLSTHPDPGDRFASLEKRASELDVDWRELRRNRDRLLAQLDGLVYGEDPRQGYFQDDLFVHPELRFEIAFPGGWRTQNLPQAVVAVSSEQDAAIELGLAAATSPAEAARRFASRQGLRTDGFAGDCPNRGECLTFTAQSEQDRLQGYVAFFRHRDRTFQLAAYASAARFGPRERVLENCS